jgi:hypothetical protein
MRVVALLLAALVSSAALPVADASASRLPGNEFGVFDFKAQGVNIRSGTSTRHTVVGSGYIGQKFCVNKIVSGQSVNGNPWWLYGKNMSTGKIGYVSAVYISAPSYGYWGDNSKRVVADIC